MCQTDSWKSPDQAPPPQTRALCAGDATQRHDQDSEVAPGVPFGMCRDLRCCFFFEGCNLFVASQKTVDSEKFSVKIENVSFPSYQEMRQLGIITAKSEQGDRLEMLAADTPTELLVLIYVNGGRCVSRFRHGRKTLLPEQSGPLQTNPRRWCASVCVQIPKTLMQEELQ